MSSFRLHLFAFALCTAQIALSQPANKTAGTSSADIAAANRFQQKLDYLKQNSEKEKPDQRPTVLAESDLNAYFAAGRVKLPNGLEKIKFSVLPGKGTVQMTVNFDELTAHSSNPLLALFTGTHLADVNAHGEGSGGIAHAHVDTVTLDGSEIPRFVLQLFVEKMLQPKYPQASLDPNIRLPEKIDLVILGERKITVTQK
jgi:hypothetical protein